MAVAGCTKCIKYMLFFFNFIFWLAGGVILGVALWLRHDSQTSNLLILQFEGQQAPRTFYIRNALSQKSVLTGFSGEVQGVMEALFLSGWQLFGTSVPLAKEVGGVYILIAVGAVMMLVGFLGCYGAIQESQCLLGTFFFFLVILFACEVAAAIWGFMNKDTMSKEFINFYDGAYIKAVDVTGSPSKDAAIAVLGAFHTTLNCCGKGDDTALFMQVASTLCPARILSEPKPKSCHRELVSLFSEKLHLIGLAALVVAAIMIFEMIFTMVLCCGIRNSPGVY